MPDKLTRLFADPAVDKRARDIAAGVGLSAVLDRRPGTLPFAGLRKIEIAKAIARDPQVLQIDEPFAGLTAAETASFSELICELRDDGRAVLLVDHNVKSVSRLVDRGPACLSRWQHRNRGAPRILVPRQRRAVERLDSCACRRIRLGRGP